MSKRAKTGRRPSPPKRRSVTRNMQRTATQVVRDDMPPGLYMRLPDDVTPDRYVLKDKNTERIRDQAVNHHTTWTATVTRIFGAIEGGGRGDQLRTALSRYLVRLNGAYTTLMQVALEWPEFHDYIRGRMEAAHVALAQAVMAALNGDSSELLKLAAQWDSDAPALVAARDAVKGGRPKGKGNKDGVLDAVYRLAQPHSALAPQWAEMRNAIWDQLKERRGGLKMTQDERTVYDEWRYMTDQARREQIRSAFEPRCP